MSVVLEDIDIRIPSGWVKCDAKVAKRWHVVSLGKDGKPSYWNSQGVFGPAQDPVRKCDMPAFLEHRHLKGKGSYASNWGIIIVPVKKVDSKKEKLVEREKELRAQLDKLRTEIEEC